MANISKLKRDELLNKIESIKDFLLSGIRDAQVEVTVPANTILYDPACHFVYSYGSEEITIAHECVHYALHKKAFIFAKFITNGHISCISCVNGGTVSGIEETNENESFMESQANGIAP